MLRVPLYLPCIVVLCLHLVTAHVAVAVKPSEALLPATTKGYVSIARWEHFEQQFDRTQIGQLLLDKSMQPFRDDLKGQLKDEIGMLSDKLGLSLEDLDGISTGEICLALIARQDKPAALALIIDVTGRGKQAAALLAKAERNFNERGGSKKTIQVKDDKLVEFRVPATDDAPELQTIYLLKDDMLCCVDDQDLAREMLQRLSGVGGDEAVLSDHPAFLAVMQRCEREAGPVDPDLRWYCDPFGFVWAWRSLDKEPLPLGNDLAKTLDETGFNAIQAVGGFVNLLLPPNLEFVHRTAVYAPPVPGKENDPLRWNLSMRMLQSPNSEEIVVEPWVPRMSASYVTVNIDIANAFDSVDSLFDALHGYEDAFETTLEGFEFDPYGPQINMRNQFVAHLGNRVSIFTDYATPITAKSERFICAIEAANTAKLAKGLEKIMKNDPDAQRREIGDVVVWEVVEQEMEFDALEIDSPAFGSLPADELMPPENTEERILPNSAVCVANGYLLVASDFEFMRHVLVTEVPSERLINSSDYEQVWKAIRQLSGKEMSSWWFSRTDESFRPTYELLRQGKMPESQTMVGKLFNELLTTEVEEEEGRLREQRLDASKLPNFETVRRYFGPAGRIIRSEPEGWFITGATLNTSGTPVVANSRR